MTEAQSFQDLIPDNHCWGCGPGNSSGLRIRSFWEDSETAICRYRPEPHQMAGPTHILNGGIIASLIDCHCVCTAMARAYRDEGRAIGSAPVLWYATASLEVQYLRPTPLASPVELRARIEEVTARRTRLTCSVTSGDQITAEGRVVAVRVPAAWRHP
jgi:acyl-coenzyme A thioesterase PaaI-like protein